MRGIVEGLGRIWQERFGRNKVQLLLKSCVESKWNIHRVVNECEIRATGACNRKLVDEN
jgi:hypothetical protein